MTFLSFLVVGQSLSLFSYLGNNGMEGLTIKFGLKDSLFNAGTGNYFLTHSCTTFIKQIFYAYTFDNIYNRNAIKILFS